jgi:ribosome-interacting GTPase 1
VHPWRYPVQVGDFEPLFSLVAAESFARGAHIQLLDTPGIIEGAAGGKGRGRQVIAVARTADLILMMLDATKGEVLTI